jgi:hypothetical protein
LLFLLLLKISNLLNGMESSKRGLGLFPTTPLLPSAVWQLARLFLFETPTPAPAQELCIFLKYYSL